MTVRPVGRRPSFRRAGVAGLSGLSLTLTYLMQVYSALQRRNELGFKT